MFKRFLIPLIILVAALGTMLWLGTLRKDQKRRPPAAFVRNVTTIRISYGPLRPVILSMGRVAPTERVQLTPEVSGLILESGFRLRKGQSFKKGDILVRIDSSQVYFSYSSTVSELQNALAGLLPELATDHPEVLDTWKNFFSRCSIDTLPELPKPKSDREKLLATRYSVYKLYYLAMQQRNTLQKHTIRAPFTGTVEETQVYPSSMARAGTAAATILRTDAVEVELALTADQLPFVRPGMAASVQIEGSVVPVSGRVERIGEVLDKRMQTTAAFVRIEGDEALRFKSGAYAQVSIAGAQIDHAAAVPRKALHNGSFVYIIDSDTLAERKAETAYLTVDTAYLTGGIEEGALLISEPLQDAVIGMAVRDISAAGRELDDRRPDRAATAKGKIRTAQATGSMEKSTEKTAAKKDGKQQKPAQ